MGDSKKVKKKCCLKFEKKGNHCSSCPLSGQDDGKKAKKKKMSDKVKTKKKEKKQGGNGKK